MCKNLVQDEAQKIDNFGEPDMYGYRDTSLDTTQNVQKMPVMSGHLYFFTFSEV